MIAFAQPWALLSLLSLPVLIYLYRLRPKRENAAVPSLMLWQKAIEIRDSQRNLQRLLRDLNLILLLALALLLSLALAQPQWNFPAQHSQDAVLIIDTSASMGARSGIPGRSRFDEAKNKASQIIATLPEGARLLLMTSARYARAQSGFESDRELLQSIVSRLQPTEEAGNPHTAFAQARTLLRSSPRAQLHFVTDGAFDSEPGLATAASEFHFVGDQRANVAVTRFDIRTALNTDDEYEVFVAVRNFGNEPVTTPLTLSMDTIELVEQNIVIEAQSETTLSLPMFGKPGKRATVRVEYDDALKVDNAAYMAFASPAPRRIILFTPGNFYLETALQELPGTVLDISPLTDTSQITDTLRGYNVVVFDRVAPPVLETGKFLLIDVAVAGFESDATQRIAATTVTGVGSSALMHDLDLSQLRITAPLKFQLPASSEATQKLFWSSDTDLAISTLQPDKRVVYLGFDLLDSNFPRQTAFPLFIRRSVEWLTASSLTSGVRNAGLQNVSLQNTGADSHERRRQIPAGESFTLELPTGTEEITIATPNGSAKAIALGLPRYTFADTSHTGLYQYNVAGVSNYIAANLTDENESDINRRLPDQADSAVTRSAAPMGVVKLALWPYVAWLALLLLIIEWWLWCVRREHA